VGNGRIIAGWGGGGGSWWGNGVVQGRKERGCAKERTRGNDGKGGRRRKKEAGAV